MKPSRRRVLTATGAALAWFASAGAASAQSAGTATATPGEPTEAVTDEAVRTLGESVTAFGVDLHDRLAAAAPEANAMASPYSASVALAMTWAGAAGETETAMADALRFPFDQDDLHPTYGELADRVDPPADESGEAATETEAETETPGEGGEEFTLETANALWGQEGFGFADSFLDLLATHYGAGMQRVDYANDTEAARRTINDWVAEQTEDTIEELLPPGVLTTLTRLVLTNAVYFSASWAEPFSDDRTSQEPFTSIDGSTASVPTMYHPEPVELPYAEVDGTQVAALPYEGGDVDMVVVLPPEGEFEAVESALDGETLTSYFDAMERTQGVVGLPRFEFESSFSLVDALAALGMGVAFDPEANFEDMMTADQAAASDLFIQEVVQDTYVSVDEDGTEASAATAVTVDWDSAPIADFELIANRPFLFAVRHRPTNAALFLGRVVSLEGDGTSEGPPAVGDHHDVPTDPDQDGLYEDVDGNGDADLADVVELFQRREGPVISEHPDAFDFSGNGEIDLADVVHLFEENTS